MIAQVMVSTEVAAIIAATCAAGGVFLGSMTSGLWVQRVENLKRHRQEMDISQKYRDPLLRASERLQTRIWHLCRRPLPRVEVNSGNVNDANSYDYAFTLFLFGQFFAWSSALEFDVPAMHNQLNKKDVVVLEILYKIHRALDDPNIQETFRVYTGIQAVIGDIMTVKRLDGSPVCIGYADFIAKWISNPPVSGPAPVKFRTWFHQIEKGLESLRNVSLRRFPCSREGKREPGVEFPKFHRLIQIQHLLIALILELDPDHDRGPRHARNLLQVPDEIFNCCCPKCNPDVTFPPISLAVIRKNSSAFSNIAMPSAPAAAHIPAGQPRQGARTWGTRTGEYGQLLGLFHELFVDFAVIATNKDMYLQKHSEMQAWSPIKKG